MRARVAIEEIAALAHRLTLVWPHDAQRSAHVRNGMQGKKEALLHLLTILKACATYHASPNARRVAQRMLDRCGRMKINPNETIEEVYAGMGMPGLGKQVNDTFAELGVDGVRIGSRTMTVKRRK